MRQACDENNQMIDWVIERTSDATIVASGTLEQMMIEIKTYPNSRRSTWAEDCLRYKGGIFYLNYEYGVK
jgi:hypothetical protein